MIFHFWWNSFTSMIKTWKFKDRFLLRKVLLLDSNMANLRKQYAKISYLLFNHDNSNANSIFIFWKVSLYLMKPSSMLFWMDIIQKLSILTNFGINYIIIFDIFSSSRFIQKRAIIAIQWRRLFINNALIPNM